MAFAMERAEIGLLACELAILAYSADHGAPGDLMLEVRYANTASGP